MPDDSTPKPAGSKARYDRDFTSTRARDGKLRSTEWFGKLDKDGFTHRSWMKNQGLPNHLFDGRPVIGICNTWSETNPCNAHFRQLADRVGGPVQRETVDHKVVGARGQVQGVLVGDDGAEGGPGLVETAHDHRVRKGPVNLFEPLLDFGDGGFVQEQLGPRIAGAGAVPQERGAVEKGGGRGHRATF